MEDYEEILQTIRAANVNTIQGFLDGLKPIERISVSEWADKYRFLSPIASSESGRYRTDRTPYLRKIMDCLSDFSPYNVVKVIKGAQLGFSEAACNFIGYIMHIAPSPTLYVMPTGDMVEVLSKTRIDTLIESCPELKTRVSSPKSRDGKNTITMKSFPGGVLRLAGANSAAGLRSTPMRNLILDEPDAYPLDLDGEGNPIDLAIQRTNTFEGKKKIFMLSTPTVSGLSAIEREFFGQEIDGKIVGGTDQNYYHVPCPFCKEKQKLVFTQLHWDEHKPHTVQYCCIHCGCLIDERHKVQMLIEKSDENPNGAEWIPEYPDRANSNVIGFHLNGLYAPYGWLSWSSIAKQYKESKNTPNKMKVFVNTILGETWAEFGEAPEYMNIYNRRELYRLNEAPADVCFLTCGVDVQKDRLELEVVGWCSDKRSYSIDYRVLDGDTATRSVWDKLAGVLNETFPRAGSTEIPIRMMCIDSGYNTTHVYDFCRRFAPDRVVPVKGQESLNMAISVPKTVDVTRSGKRIGKVRVWSVGVSFLKSELYSWLRLEKENGIAPPCYCHFPQYDENYFKGLTAEKQVKKIVRGYPRFEWVKDYERNEPLDIRIYNRAAASIVGLDRLTPTQIEKMSAKQVKVKRTEAIDTTNVDATAAPTKRRRGDFWDDPHGNNSAIW